MRLKRNITPVNQAMETIKRLNPVVYRKKLSLSDNSYPIQEYGFIAQEVQDLLPDVVAVDKGEDKILTLNYLSILPVLGWFL